MKFTRIFRKSTYTRVRLIVKLQKYATYVNAINLSHYMTSTYIDKIKYIHAKFNVEFKLKMTSRTIRFGTF